MTIRELRQAARLTQQQMAGILEFHSQSSYARVERQNGKSKNFIINLLCSLSSKNAIDLLQLAASQRRTMKSVLDDALSLYFFK